MCSNLQAIYRLEIKCQSVSISQGYTPAILCAETKTTQKVKYVVERSETNGFYMLLYYSISYESLGLQLKVDFNLSSLINKPWKERFNDSSKALFCSGREPVTISYSALK